MAKWAFGAIASTESFKHPCSVQSLSLHPVPYPVTVRRVRQALAEAIAEQVLIVKGWEISRSRFPGKTVTDPGKIDGVGQGNGRFHDRESPNNKKPHLRERLSRPAPIWNSAGIVIT